MKLAGLCVQTDPDCALIGRPFDCDGSDAAQYLSEQAFHVGIAEVSQTPVLLKFLVSQIEAQSPSGVRLVGRFIHAMSLSILALSATACVHLEPIALPPPSNLLEECRADEPEGMETGAYLVRVTKKGLEVVSRCWFFPKERPPLKGQDEERPARDL